MSDPGQPLNFIKMHGLGNDFVILDCRERSVVLAPAALALLADRRRGVGCDQVIQLVPSARATARMIIYNADASQAEMCGNAARCVAAYLHAREPGGCASLTLETLAGVVTATIQADGRVAVDMGEPILEGREIPSRWEGVVVDRPLVVAEEGTEFPVTLVSMGNPHCVVFTDHAAGFPLERVGPLVEHHVNFPNRVNLEVVEVMDRSRLRMRVWERGSGITQACGSGACAAAVAAMLRQEVGRTVTVALDGGELEIAWREDSGRVIMTGPATEVFRGTMTVPPG